MMLSLCTLWCVRCMMHVPTNLTRSTIITSQMWQMTCEWARLQLNLPSRIFVTRAASFNICNCVLPHSLFTLRMVLRVEGKDYFSTQYKQTDLCNEDVACCETCQTALKVHTQSRWISGFQILLWRSANNQAPKNQCRVRKKYSFKINYRKLVDRIFFFFSYSGGPGFNPWATNVIYIYIYIYMTLVA